MIARKPKRGRPSLGAAALSRGVTIKISDEIHARWSAQAEAADLSLGEWVRRRIDPIEIVIRPDGDTWHMTAERLGAVLACGGIDLPLTVVDARLEDAAVQYAVDSGCGTVDQCQAAMIRIER